MRAINNNVNYIVTPITTCFSQVNVANGYTVYVQNEDKGICLNKLIENGEIRYSQNAEKMLLSGCFGIVKNDN